MAVLKELGERARLVGIDRDPEALEVARTQLGHDARVILWQASFSKLPEILAEAGVDACHGILADLGVSSHQIDSPQRGFSYMQNGPLDMRMDPTTGRSAADLLRTESERELARIIGFYGEERAARKIAHAVVERRKYRPVETTAELAEIVQSVVPPPQRIKSMARVFQALRIAVNQELMELERFLPAALQVLRPGGRLVVLTYHSLEDRLVKRFMVERARGCICAPDAPICTCGHKPEIEILTKKPVTPSEEEVEENPRARSAKLRACRKV